MGVPFRACHASCPRFWGSECLWHVLGRIFALITIRRKSPWPTISVTHKIPALVLLPASTAALLAVDVGKCSFVWISDFCQCLNRTGFLPLCHSRCLLVSPVARHATSWSTWSKGRRCWLHFLKRVTEMAAFWQHVIYHIKCSQTWIKFVTMWLYFGLWISSDNTRRLRVASRVIIPRIMTLCLIRDAFRSSSITAYPVQVCGEFKAYYCNTRQGTPWAGYQTITRHILIALDRGRKP